MLDALGDALQKLSTVDPAVAKSVVAGPDGTACGSSAPAEPCSAQKTTQTASIAVAVSAPAPVAASLALQTPVVAAEAVTPASVVATAVTATGCCSPEASSSMPAESCECPAPAVPSVLNSAAGETSGNPSSTAPQASPPTLETRTAGSSTSRVTRLQLLAAAIREHRHMVAALVIGVCGMTLWRDTHSPVRDSLAAGDDPVTSVDAFLDDFEAADRASLPEPAEPAAADPDSDAPLLIPSTLTSANPEGTDGTGRPSTSSVPASYPDQDPFPATTSGAADSQAAPKSRPLRFTGRIQPAR
ncbi:MAG: hypothetical protein U0996_24175 [Planctomycetaceae bacterium]